MSAVVDSDRTGWITGTRTSSNWHFLGSKVSFWVSEPGWQGTGWTAGGEGVTVEEDSSETVIAWIVVAGRTGTSCSVASKKWWDIPFFQICGREDTRREGTKHNDS